MQDDMMWCYPGSSACPRFDEGALSGGIRDLLGRE